jgi:DNA-binding NtrC family response regulator
VPLLARHFLALLRRHSYPGNVRELSNIIERAVALAAGPRIEASDLPDLAGRPAAELPPAPPSPAPPRDAPSATEQERLLDALRQTNWNVSRAAARLGVSRNTLRYRMEKYGLHS